MDSSHPCRNLVDKWKGLSRLHQKSVLHVVKDLKTQHHLPENREKLHKVIKEMPPHRNLKTPIIKQNLLGGETKKSDPNCLKASALETIDQYSREWIHIYTDGSAFKATINAGYGVEPLSTTQKGKKKKFLVHVDHSVPTLSQRKRQSLKP